MATFEDGAGLMNAVAAAAFGLSCQEDSWERRAFSPLSLGAAMCRTVVLDMERFLSIDE